MTAIESSSRETALEGGGGGTPAEPADRGGGGTPAEAADRGGPVLRRLAEGIRRRPSVTVVATVVLFLFTAVQHPTKYFYYDAGGYWNGSLALFDKRSIYAEGVLSLRGILTPFVYAPAALGEKIVTGSGPALVLAENSLIIALIGAVLLPGIARSLGARGPAVIWVSSVLVWLVAARLATYPLMDVTAAAAFLFAVLLAFKKPMYGLVIAGLAAGVTFNLRPAYLAPIAALAVGVALRRRLRAVGFAVGLAVGLAPQLVFNLVRHLGTSLVPPRTGAIADLQTEAAAYLVRYDTVLITNPPQQVYCDPHMAQAIDGDKVTSTGEFARVMVTNMPESLLFLGKKLAASLAWSSYTPYAAPATIDNPNALFLLATITVVGVLALYAVARRPWPGYGRTLPILLIAMVLMVSCSVMASAAETRFALPIVLLGVVGCAAAAPTIFKRAWWHDRRRSLGWSFAAVAGIALIVLLAAWGLSDAPALGPASTGLCASVG